MQVLLFEGVCNMCPRPSPTVGSCEAAGSHERDTPVRRSLLGPADPSFRALSGRLEFTVQCHTFNNDSLSTQVLLFDGVCNMCSGTVNFIIARDPTSLFKFAALQVNTCSLPVDFGAS